MKQLIVDFSGDDLVTLCRLAQVSKELEELAECNPLWKALTESRYPLFARPKTKIVDAVDGVIDVSQMAWKERFEKIFTMAHSALVQLFIISQVHVRDVYITAVRGGSYAVRRAYHPSGVAGPVEGSTFRPRPEELHDSPSGEVVYIPPKPFAEYFQPGEEVELQWGAGWYWWRGIVDKIQGNEMVMIFPHFEPTSSYYRETAIYGQKNNVCGGVRKLSEEEKIQWRELLDKAGIIAFPPQYAPPGYKPPQLPENVQ